MKLLLLPCAGVHSYVRIHRLCSPENCGRAVTHSAGERHSQQRPRSPFTQVLMSLCRWFYCGTNHCRLECQRYKNSTEPIFVKNRLLLSICPSVTNKIKIYKCNLNVENYITCTYLHMLNHMHCFIFVATFLCCNGFSFWCAKFGVFCIIRVF